MTEGPQPYSASTTGATGKNPYVRPAIATVLLLVLLSIFISAGFWQLGRATEKKGIEDTFRTGTGQDVLTQPVNDEAADSYRFRKLQLEGRYDPARQILLDNIVHAGVNGYEVLTPFRTHNRTIMVNRGWIRANPDRRVLPDIDVTDDLRTVTGIVNTFPVPGLRFATEYPADAPWPRRMLYPTQEAIAETLDTQVASYQLLLIEDQPDGYSRKWEALDLGVTTHYGYAFQWFSFAVVAIVFYLILMMRWLRDVRRQPNKD
jgi:surfeit locus 1 family protein